jgi:hypothetical protein
LRPAAAVKPNLSTATAIVAQDSKEYVRRALSAEDQLRIASHPMRHQIVFVYGTERTTAVTFYIPDASKHQLA